MLVYLITNTKNGKLYVGQTTRSLDRRWLEHCGLSGKCRVLENAIRKHGIEAFEVSEVARVQTQEELNRLERLTCEALNAYVPHGYNLREGGGAKGKMHEETKAIIRELALSPARMEAFKAMTERPDVRAKYVVIAKKRAAASVKNMASGRTPEIEAARKAASAKAWGTDKVRQAQSKRQTEIQARPEVKAKKSATVAAYWAAMTDEQRVERGRLLSERLKGIKKTIDRSPAAVAKRSAIKTALWADPDHRAKMLVINSDPEVLKRRGDAIRAGHAKKKAERQALITQLPSQAA